MAKLLSRPGMAVVMRGWEWGQQVSWGPQRPLALGSARGALSPKSSIELGLMFTLVFAPSPRLLAQSSRVLGSRADEQRLLRYL